MSAAAADFDALVAEFYEAWFRFHPQAAMSAGVSGFQGGFPAVDDDDAGALGAWLESTIVGLEELDYHGLDDDRRTDMELLFGACRDEHQSMLERDWRHRDPVGFLPFQVIHQLMAAPDIDLQTALETCIPGVPEYLRHARNQLSIFPQLIPPEWCRAAIVEAESGNRYLRQLARNPAVSRAIRRPHSVEACCDQAIDAVDAFVDFLKHEIGTQASGSLALGPERFFQKLYLRHGLSCSGESLRHLITGVYDDTLEAVRQLSMEIYDTEDTGAVLKQLAQNEVLGPEAALQLAREQGVSLRSFVSDRGIAEFPVAARLKVLTLPSCPRPRPCPPTYLPPTVGESGMTGVQYISDPPEGGQGWLPEVLIAECIRHGWPGRHMQSVIWGNSGETSGLVRRLNTSSSMLQGWPLYAEQLLYEQGYSSAPGQSLMRLVWRLRMALRALIDLELHTNLMTSATAKARLAALPDGSSIQAENDLLEISRHPTDSLSGVVGWSLISELRRQMEQDDSFRQRDFHHALLSPGPIAATQVIRRVFGEAVLSQLMERLTLEG